METTMIENRRFLELRVPKARGGGFPPDHLFWEKKNDKVRYYDKLKFSGCWVEPKKGNETLSEYRYWAWEETDNEKVEFAPTWAGVKVKSEDGKTIYKILGFRRFGTVKHARGVCESGEYRTVWTESEFYTIVVEIFE